MKPANNFTIVVVTTPSIQVARELAQAALNARLIACANLVPGIESLYWWQEAIQSDKEVLMVLKTKKTLLKKLEALVRRLHPYDTPEVLAIPITSGSARYLEWIRAETA